VRSPAEALAGAAASNALIERGGDVERDGDRGGLWMGTALVDPAAEPLAERPLDRNACEDWRREEDGVTPTPNRGAGGVPCVPEVD